MTEVSQANVPMAGWRLKLGVTLFGLSIVLPVLVLTMVAATGLSATISGVMLAGSEVLGIVAVAGDLLLLTSLFVLGGDFWDKLRALFIGGAKVVFPQKTS